MRLTALLCRYSTEVDARRWFEQAHWPDGPVCLWCGVLHQAFRLSTRSGQFTYEHAGTVLEDLAMLVRFSRAPLAYGTLQHE